MRFEPVRPISRNLFLIMSSMPPFANNPWWTAINEEGSSPWVGHTHYQVQLLAQDGDLWYFRVRLQGIVTWATVLVMLFQLVPNSIQLQLQSVYTSAMALLTGTVAYLGRSYLAPLQTDHLRASLRGLSQDREEVLLSQMQTVLRESHKALVDWWCSLDAAAGSHVEEIVTALVGASAATEEQERITFVGCCSRFFQSVMAATERRQIRAQQPGDESDWSPVSPQHLAHEATGSGPSAGN